MSEIRDRTIGKIERKLKRSFYDGNILVNPYSLTEVANRIISIPELAVMDREAGPPENPFSSLPPQLKSDINYAKEWGYSQCLINIRMEGWVKEVKE